jgi:hypothetical protein
LRYIIFGGINDNHKQRKHNGLVLLSGGGRKVQPIEIEVVANVYRLLLLSFEKPMQETTAERICEIAGDFHRKIRTLHSYRCAPKRIALGSAKTQQQKEQYLRALNATQAMIDQKLSAPEEKYVQSVLLAGGF